MLNQFSNAARDYGLNNNSELHIINSEMFSYLHNYIVLNQKIELN